MLLTEPPWPAPTPPPQYPYSSKYPNQLLHHHHIRNIRRQDAANVNCDDVGNEVLSCAPTTGQIVVQNTTVHFVWNRNEPSFAQFNRVDVYLFHEDTLTIATSKLDLQNQAGRVAFDVNDQWWGPRGASFAGQNISYPMYFVIVPTNHTLTGGETPQSTFTAIQTRLPDSILAQQASASSASAASSSAASLSSAGASHSGSSSSSSPFPSSTATGSNNGNSGLQANASGDSFPKWAIALIVILGALALLAFFVAFYFIVRAIRRSKSRKRRPDSMGSSTPIMATVNNGDGQRDPLVTPSGGPGGEPISPVQESSHGHGSVFPIVAPAPINPDRGRSSAASTTTRETGADPALEAALLTSSFRDNVHAPHGPTVASAPFSSSNVHAPSGPAPFSGADAEIMAAAFRDKLRKPDFADRPLEEGESPDSDPKKDVLQRELAEEGRDLRSVSSSRVRVEGDEVGTVHERPGSFDFPSVDSG